MSRSLWIGSAALALLLLAALARGRGEAETPPRRGAPLVASPKPVRPPPTPTSRAAALVFRTAEGREGGAELLSLLRAEPGLWSEAIAAVGCLDDAAAALRVVNAVRGEIEPPVEALWIGTLSAGSPVAREAAVAALSARPTDASLRALAAAASGDPDPRVRRAAASSLASVRPRITSPETAALIDRSIDASAVVAPKPPPSRRTLSLRSKS